MPGTLAKHRRILSTALAASLVAALVLIASGFPDRIGPGARRAAAAPATALVPARVRMVRQPATSPHAIDPASDRSGIILYFLMEAARPQPLFAR